MKIILVDDNLHFVEDLKFFIENKLSHKVIAMASSGEESLAIENLCDADIILMDLSMEPMNGFDATKNLLLNFPQLKIIAITMNTDNMSFPKLIGTGFKGFIYKTEIYKSLETVMQSVYSDGELLSEKFCGINNLSKSHAR